MGQTRSFVRQIACIPVKLYQYFISPSIGSCCRFYPSCSQYAIDAITHYGLFKGSYLACYRLMRCHPWSKGGYDAVLLNKEKV